VKFKDIQLWMTVALFGTCASIFFPFVDRGCPMSNVVRLFSRMNAEIALSKPEAGNSPAATDVLAASTQQLANTVRELSRQFDAIESVISTIEDSETRKQLKQSTKLSRETLSEAMLKLSRQIVRIADHRGA
jgi:hypothetical protein